MNGLLQQLGISLRLHFRNRMALLYSYLFPTIFLVAFWVLYRHDQVPLVRHMGELLTVTALGGACFGLPTTLVSERERGVWRRYRLAPVPTGTLVASTVVARYFLLLLAGLLQLALAMAIGMPMPLHPFDLWLAFTFVAFAFLGLGLVIAMLADNVPAVQALGQCIFLPMLIIGGVAVRLEALPPWAQHVSAFFPGRYAVEAIQSTVNGEGLGAARFALLALLLTGAAGSLAGARMFRWDAQQRFASRRDKGWVAVALAAWIAVGLLAEATDRIAVAGTPRASGGGEAALGLYSTRAAATDSTRLSPEEVTALADSAPAVPAVEPGTPDTASAEAPAAARPDTAPRVAQREAAPPAASPPGAPAGRPSGAPPAATERPAASPPAEAAPRAAGSAPWQAVTLADIEREITFDRLPPDAGVVTPIAPANEPLHPYLENQMECIRRMLPEWGPGKVADPVQRVRNYLYVAAVPDVFQMEEIESIVPLVVFERLQRAVPREQLIKILYWIAMHPGEGDDGAVDRLREVCLDSGGPSDVEQLRERTAIYAVKLLGRLTGKITPR